MEAQQEVVDGEKPLYMFTHNTALWIVVHQSYETQNSSA